MLQIMLILGISRNISVIFWESFTVAGDSVLDVLQFWTLFSVGVKFSTSELSTAKCD